MANQYTKSYEERDTFFSNDVPVQQDERKVRKIYSTAMINQLIADRNAGYDIDYEPFYMKDLDLKSPNISFMMTDEEYEEYQKCYDDALYYVENYCKFMTDNGMTLVELRDFQKNVITTVTDEVYLEDKDLFGPKNRNVIWMSARQSGKCHIYPNILYTISENDSDLTGEQPYSIGEIYDKYNTTGNKLLKVIKKWLYKIYQKL